MCWFFCPDNSVQVEDGRLLGFDLEQCKGCGLCAAACPDRVRAIEMENDES
jgi:pyruvate ferredoxin oxidoreductase delta subunit